MDESPEARATVAIRSLLSRAFRDELHRLLWMEPFVNRGEHDGGWSCRDHAVVLGLFLAVHGLPASLARGKCMFVQGPRGSRPPVALGQELAQSADHAWLELADRILDLSPNLSATGRSAWPGAEFQGIVFDEWQPKGAGRLERCGDPYSYDHAVARATHIEGALVAVYYRAMLVPTDHSSLVNLAAKLDSPLADRVYPEHGRQAYLAATAHLCEFAGGRARPIAGLSQRKAWRCVLAANPSPASVLGQRD
jgi:hypothetical protein